MMGRLDGFQEQLFYEFSLEGHVPPDHLLRRIDHVLDLSFLHRALAPFCARPGRPSIDPELIIRMLLVGYCFGIRSERRLCEEVHLNLAYRWFCRLGLEGPVPDHTTFSKNRHGRFRQSDIFRLVFETVVRACMEAGLVGGEGFAVDASVLEANASRFRRAEAGESVDWSEPKFDTRAVREYLASLDAEAPPEVESGPDDEAGQGDLTDRSRIGLDDQGPLSRLLRLCCQLPYRPEDGRRRRCRTVAGAVVTGGPFGADDAGAHTRPPRTVADRLAADTAYGSGWMLGWLVGQNIAPHIPVWDKSQREDGTLSRSEFAFDAARNVYICPRGKLLRTTGTIHDRGRTLRYRALTSDCVPCPLKQTCCPNTPLRNIPRDVHEAARDVARSLANTHAFAQSRRDRKKVEMTFAHLKCVLGITRLRLRGMTGAHDEMLLAATAQNLRRLVRRLAPHPQTAPA